MTKVDEFEGNDRDIHAAATRLPTDKLAANPIQETMLPL